MPRVYIYIYIYMASSRECSPCNAMVFLFGFYVTHRCLHSPALYKWIHKVHHRYIHPSAVYGLYAHPLKILVSNAPVMICLYLWPRVLAWYQQAFFMTAILNVIATHTSHRIQAPMWMATWFPNATFHYVHHRRFTSNYGLSNERLARWLGTTVDGVCVY